MEQLGWLPFEGVGFSLHAGPLWVRTNSDGSPSLGLYVLAHHTNYAGYLHGGMLMALLDQGLGMHISHTTGRSNLTAQLDIHFCEAASEGHLVEVEAEVIRTTNRLCFARGRAHVGGKTLATATGVWASRSNAK